MNDTLEYMGLDPFFRKGAHDKLTFRMMYAHTERFLLALSHDEVVHGKRSLLQRMPGDLWQKFANLRLLYAYQFAMTGKKLLFMGSELGQWKEWNHDAELDWALESQPMHQGLRAFLADLNALYRREPALHVHDVDGQGFEWIDCHDSARSMLTLVRWGGEGDPPVAVALNFTPVVRHDVRIGVPEPGLWTQLLSSDARVYGGSGVGEIGEVIADEPGEQGRPVAIRITVPPLGAAFYRGPVRGDLSAGNRDR
jgi:1,4-alpha-glucan branching enzyme